MLNLVRHFGELDLTQTKDGNQIFFNLFGSKMITYSEQLVIPIMLIAVILFAFTMVHGYRRKKLSILGTLAGLLVIIGGIIGSFVIGLGLWSLLTSIFSEKEWMMGTDITFGTTYLISFSMIIFAFLNFLYIIANKKVKVGNLTMGALLIWLVLLVVTSFLLRSGSYVFAWPLLFGLIGPFRRKLMEGLSCNSRICHSIVLDSIPCYLSYSNASINGTCKCAYGTSFLTWSNARTFFSTLKIKSNWIMPSILLGVGLLVMITNSITINNMPTAEHPKASDITFFMDEDSNKAYWAARHALDEYTSNYINEDVMEGNTSEFFPLLNWDVKYSEANLFHMKATSVTVLSDEVDVEKRTIEYQLKTNRQAEEIFMQSLSKMNVSKLIINGKEAELTQNKYTKKQPLLLTYIVGQTGALNVKVTIDAKDSIEWIVADRSYSIPEIKGERSPEYSTYGDNSFIMKTIRD